jgi:hypothetical protein
MKSAPYPADTRAKGWRFELDLERIRQSDTWALASADLRPWLLLLWATAWEQTPCGSLPSDIALIAARIGMALKVFEKHRAILLRGWFEAEDGRLYNNVITERVLAMMQSRRKEADRKALARAKSDMGSSVTPGVVPLLSRGTSTGLHHESATGTGTGTGTEEGKVSKASPSHPAAKATGKPTPTIPCPYDTIVAAYHIELPTLPKVLVRDGKLWTARQKAMRELWGWVLSSRKSDGTPRAETAEQALEWLAGYFRRASENDFLMGRTHSGEAHKNWRCDFDYLLTQRGLKSVIEKTQDAA